MATRGWPKPDKPVARIELRFGDQHHDILTNVSAGTRVGDTMFVASDEDAILNRFLLRDGLWQEDGSCHLDTLLPLEWKEEEADLEGLAVDDGWLWLVGSHARTRRKPEKEADACIDLDRLADLKDTRPRCLLARVPMVERGDGHVPVARDGDRRAGMLRQTKHGNALAKALRKDPLIAPFTRVPAKEGGVDVEGIAVCGDRIAIGMRGPVIATHALLVEFRFTVKPSGRLAIVGTPFNRLLAMEGLGIRDLKRCDDDLLILAGPTTGLSGPCALYRWKDWAKDPPRDAHKVRLHRPERIVELPFGRGTDHPEGLALWDADTNGLRHILVLNDSPGADRVDPEHRTIVADLFRLPG
ncbi:DUF3616 domain-containing protein [Sphingomonas sanxanigenens]|uniref:DUF3616 domain-containing protein n=1 Tax=Sphingomonas sanxanigenens DSM 19645 = NX02 TaxID=1123269 RepID=W0AJB2_9SPHN|nr:DUF3616 domain-containing protein [Sphingomonas sanxanigenens]AHE56637.1 hypothetical protein NX02_25150 [Sphingomonas sanxanigenens DSM 19645 = NX02]